MHWAHRALFFTFRIKSPADRMVIWIFGIEWLTILLFSSSHDLMIWRLSYYIDAYPHRKRCTIYHPMFYAWSKILGVCSQCGTQLTDAHLYQEKKSRSNSVALCYLSVYNRKMDGNTLNISKIPIYWMNDCRHHGRCSGCCCCCCRCETLLIDEVSTIVSPSPADSHQIE